MTAFSERLKELRLEKNLNQIELAECLDCNRQKIADMERGKTSPNVEVLIKLSKLFDVSTDYLLGLSNSRAVDKDTAFVCEYTGLSEKAVETLVRGNKEHQEYVREDIIYSEFSDIISRFIEECSADLYGYVHSYDASNFVIDICSDSDNVGNYIDLKDFINSKDFTLFMLQELIKKFAKRYANRGRIIKGTKRTFNNSKNSNSSDDNSEGGV